ncbi:MAG: ribulose-phosphate 3-epimerase [Actinobacteria bacterium]|nr:ribulose-phosphate 3-epimerase [Actinomycetota bacterium]
MLMTARELIDGGPGLSVGVLTADLLRLGEELEALDHAGIRLAHVDVMDGVFCPQLTAGPPLVKALPDRFVKDVHLMVVEPLEKAHAYVEAGAGILTFHVESTRHPHRVLQSLAGSGVVRGVAFNPGTPVATIEPLLDELELVLVLAVNPGWGGQSFIPSTERRVAEVRELVEGREIVVAVDGGVTKANVGRIASLGVDLIVTGSAVFDGVAPAANARAMREAVARADGGTQLAGIVEEGQ